MTTPVLWLGWGGVEWSVGDVTDICAVPEVGSIRFFPASKLGVGYLSCKRGTSGPTLLGSQVCREASGRESGRTKGGTNKCQRLILLC